MVGLRNKVIGDRGVWGMRRGEGGMCCSLFLNVSDFSFFIFPFLDIDGTYSSGFLGIVFEGED